MPLSGEGEIRCGPTWYFNDWRYKTKINNKTAMVLILQKKKQVHHFEEILKK